MAQPPSARPHADSARFVYIAAGIAAIGGLLGIGAWFFVYFLVPETKGRSLEEIEAYWRAGKHPRAMGT